MVCAQLPCPREKITVRPSGDSRGSPSPPPGMGTVSVLIRWLSAAEYTAATAMTGVVARETPMKSAGKPAVTPAVAGVLVITVTGAVAGGAARGAVAAEPPHPVAMRNNPAASMAPAARTEPATIAPPSYPPDP